VERESLPKAARRAGARRRLALPSGDTVSGDVDAPEPEQIISGGDAEALLGSGFQINFFRVFRVFRGS
jgi:hypothetical protein